MGDQKAETESATKYPYDRRERLRRSWGTRWGRAAAARCCGCGEQGCGELLVEGEEELDALSVGGECLLAIASLDGAVEALVSLDEFGRHRQRVIKCGEGGVGVEGAGLKDGLGLALDCSALGVGQVQGPRICVVDQRD